MHAYEITIWCSSKLSESELADALECGELYDKATEVQYRIAKKADG